MGTEDIDARIEANEPPAEEFEGEVNDKDTITNSAGEEETDGEAVVKKIINDVVGNQETEDTDNKTDEVPEEFKAAAASQGWSEEEIAEFAKGLDTDALIELIPDFIDDDEEDEEDEEQDDSDEEDKTQSDTTAKKESKLEKDEIAKLRAEFKKELEAIRAKDKEREEALAQERVDAMVSIANQAFDEASKDFEIFGKTDELLRYPAGPRKGQLVPTSPAMRARISVWEKAAPFIESGMNVKDAIDIGLTWYKGANLERDVHQKVIKDLKKKESKLSGKRAGKETVQTFEDEEDYKAEVVRRAAREAGVKGI